MVARPTLKQAKDWVKQSLKDQRITLVTRDEITSLAIEYRRLSGFKRNHGKIKLGKG